MSSSFSSEAQQRLLARAKGLISTQPGLKSLAGWIASQSEELQLALIEGLSAPALAALPFLFEVWGRIAHQIEPEGDWVTWVVMGGRGSGKTRTGAEWIRAQVEGATPLAPGLVRRVALLAETWEQAREVMVFGDSGLVACSPRDRVPDYVATRRKLIWPNGAEATLFSAADPESLRGPQFDCAWSDELAKWRRADAAWDMLQFGLRLGERPRQIVTTTPRDIILLRTILADPATVTTRSPTADNRANLAPDFLEKITRRYNGTFTGRQELDGELLDTEGGLFRRSLIEAARVERAPKMDLIVVGVDPPASDGPGADECGIVVVGRSADVFYVLADYSLAGASPARWAAAAVQALRAHQALRIVAEVNQGGNMVATVLQAVDRAVMVRSERARDGKRVRAEPVAALYEQGRVRHVGHFPVLEDQLVAFGREKRSPDRVDALVWAVADLVHEPSGGPRVSFL